MKFKDLLKSYFENENLYKDISKYITEEKTIGFYKNCAISVYSEPLGNPSFHIRYKNGEVEQVFQIKDLKALEYKTKKTFNQRFLKDFKKWLSSSNKINPEKSNWESLIELWNGLNPNYKISTDIKIPN